LWCWMNMQQDECSRNGDHARGRLMYVAPLRTPTNVHKKNPGRRRMGEPKPTRASMVMVAPPEVLRNAEGVQSEGRGAKRDGKDEKRDRAQYKGRRPKAPARLSRTAGEGMPISAGVMR
jgi:hypothetical protein